MVDLSGVTFLRVILDITSSFFMHILGITWAHLNY